MWTRADAVVFFALFASLLLPGPVAGEEPDSAAELIRRTYCLHTPGPELLAVGSAYGVVLHRLDGRGVPVRAGALPMEDAVTALAGTGDLLYVANGPRGLAVVDVADPDAPREIARVETPGAVLRLLPMGEDLFAALGTLGVGHFRLDDPRLPVLRKRLEVEGNTRDLCPAPGRGLAVAAGVFVWVQDPAAESPVLRPSGLPEPGAVLDLDRTLLVAGRATILPVDVMGLLGPGAAPVVLGDEIRDLEPVPGGVAAAAGSDGLVLLARDGPRLRVAARTDPGGACNRVHARGTRLFATADAAGFAVYDVGDLANPVKIFPEP
ncbi:MAG: hypothetical protein FJ098_14710 [Deltaproteobacteria bacterium]|nr:hypothetical protein [Deltaproteobacteria bacterium]